MHLIYFCCCSGHVELAMLLLERGANIEEVNDEGYTPLMEAAREGHEEMVALLLSQVQIIANSDKKHVNSYKQTTLVKCCHFSRTIFSGFQM
jgi:ankyrin repeat domain-containing protein 17